MKLDRRCFMMGIGSCIAAPFIIKNSSILMPIRDRGIIDPFYTGLYMTRDYGTLLDYKKHITVPRNEFRKFNICNPGDVICNSYSPSVGEIINNKHNSNYYYKYSFWLLKGAEAQRLITLT